MYDDGDDASGGEDDDHGGHGADYVMRMMTFVVINIRQLVLVLFIRYMMAETIVLTTMTVKLLGAKMLGFLIMIMCLIPCIMMTILVVMIMMTVTMIWVAEISFFLMLHLINFDFMVLVFLISGLAVWGFILNAFEIFKANESQCWDPKRLRCTSMNYVE